MLRAESLRRALIPRPQGLPRCVEKAQEIHPWSTPGAAGDGEGGALSSGVPPAFNGTGCRLPCGRGVPEPWAAPREGRGGAEGAGHAQGSTHRPGWSILTLSQAGFHPSAAGKWVQALSCFPQDRVDLTLPPGAGLNPWLLLCGSSRACPAPSATPLVHGWELLLLLCPLAGALSSLVVMRAVTEGAIDPFNAFNKEMGLCAVAKPCEQMEDEWAQGRRCALVLVSPRAVTPGIRAQDTRIPLFPKPGIAPGGSNPLTLPSAVASLPWQEQVELRDHSPLAPCTEVSPELFISDHIQSGN